MANSQKEAKKIANPCIGVQDDQVFMTWVECNKHGENDKEMLLTWEDLHELGIEDWMIRVAIKDALESDDEFFNADVSVFHGIVEFPHISSQMFDITPEIAEKLNSNGFEITTGQPTQFMGSNFSPADHYTEPIPENYVPDIVPHPDNPDMYIGSEVEGFGCPESYGHFRARPLIYCNPHTGEEYFFCLICKKAGRKNPWHPYIMGHKELGYDEQSIMTAIHALGDGHSVYEIAKYCGEEFKGNWDKRKILRICDKLSRDRKITYMEETRNNHRVKLVFLNRANH